MTQNGTRSVVKSEELGRAPGTVAGQRLPGGHNEGVVGRELLTVRQQQESIPPGARCDWEFIARYLDDRFPDDWRLSPRHPLLFGRQSPIPAQAIVRSSKANNQLVKLPSNTSLYLLRTRETEPAETRNQLRLMPIEEVDLQPVTGGLENVRDRCHSRHRLNPRDKHAATTSAGRRPQHVGGRIAGALRHLGSAGRRHHHRGRNPPIQPLSGQPVRPDGRTDQLDARRTQAPVCYRIKNLWAKMGKDALDHIGFQQVRINDRNG